MIFHITSIFQVGDKGIYPNLQNICDKHYTNTGSYVRGQQNTALNTFVILMHAFAKLRTLWAILQPPFIMNRISDKTFEQYYSELFDSIKLKIAAESDDYIITQPAEDLIKYYSSNCLNPIELDLEREESLEHQKYVKTIFANQ